MGARPASGYWVCKGWNETIKSKAEDGPIRRNLSVLGHRFEKVDEAIGRGSRRQLVTGSLVTQAHNLRMDGNE